MELHYVISYLFLQNLCISNQLAVLLCAINTLVLHRSIFHMAIQWDMDYVIRK